MPESAPETHRIDGQDHTVIASSPYMPKEDRHGRPQPMINILRNDETGKLRLEISDLDPTNFEAVVGRERAERYRAFVAARNPPFRGERHGPLTNHRTNKLTNTIKSAKGFLGTVFNHD